MIQSVIVYGLMIACFWILGNSAGKAQLRNPKIKFWTRDICIIIFVFAIICGLRNLVGVDWYQYKEDFIHPSESFEQHTEWLYAKFVMLLSGIGAHYSVYFTLVAFFQIFFLLYAFKDDRFIYPFLLFVLMTNSTFFMWMNGMRQCLSLSLFIFATRFIDKREPLQFFATMAIATLIHKTALLLLPFYLPFFSKDLFKNKILQLALLVLAVFLSSTAIWKDYLGQIEVVANLMGFGEETRSVEDRFLLYDDIQYDKGYRFYATVFLGVICILFGDKVKKKYNVNLWYNMFYLGILSYLIFYSAPLLTRATAYFIYSQFILIAYTLHYLYKNKNSINISVFIGMMVCLALYLLVEIESNWYTQYYFIWQTPERLSSF